jgi:putative Mg2+ transporter-C (MgtC) family protein
VRGLTTAATLWVVAAIGMAAGVGYYEAAVVTTALVLISLWPLRILAYRLAVRVRPEEGRLAVDLPSGASAVSVLEAVERAGANVRSLEFEEEGDRRRIDLHVRLGTERSAAELIDALTQAEHVRGARWNP